MTTKTAPKVTSLDAIRKRRSVVVPGPSGNIYRVQALNLERHALSGSMPAPLRQIARDGQAGIEAVFAEESDSVFTEQGNEVREYLDGIVRLVLVEPDLTDFDLGELPPIDYRWAVGIAMGEVTTDGKGRLLWGQEPLSRWDTFRLHHDCPEDCDKCQRVLQDFQAWTV